MQEGCLDPAPVWSDLATFDGRPWHQRIYILTAGIPCQPWSCAGQKKGVYDDRWIWEDVHRIVRQVNPPVIFLENVPGFISGGLERVLTDLAAMGYDAEWGVFSAGEIGAPHKRERLFIIAVMEHADRIRFKNKISFKNGRMFNKSGGFLGHVSRQNLFAPRPGENKKWHKTIASKPWLKPAICRKDDRSAKVVGMPGQESWMAQLRCLGNSVVPVTAGLAFGILGRRIGLI